MATGLECIVDSVIARAPEMEMQCRPSRPHTVDDTSAHGLLPCPPVTQVADDGRPEGKTAANHTVFEQGECWRSICRSWVPGALAFAQP